MILRNFDEDGTGRGVSWTPTTGPVSWNELVEELGLKARLFPLAWEVFWRLIFRIKHISFRHKTTNNFNKK